MKLCGHRDEQRVCILPADDQHIAHTDGTRTWPNEDLQAELARRPGPTRGKPTPERQKQLRRLAGRVQMERHVNPLADEAFARTNDPANSHEAIEGYSSKRPTSRDRVLAYLRQHQGEWVDSHDLTRPEVGGDEGKRRLRELRQMGCYTIETRRQPGSETNWQHRLVGGD